MARLNYQYVRTWKGEIGHRYSIRNSTVRANSGVTRLQSSLTVYGSHLEEKHPVLATSDTAGAATTLKRTSDAVRQPKSWAFSKTTGTESSVGLSATKQTILVAEAEEGVGTHMVEAKTERKRGKKDECNERR